MTLCHKIWVADPACVCLLFPFSGVCLPVVWKSLLGFFCLCFLPNVIATSISFCLFSTCRLSRKSTTLFLELTLFPVTIAATSPISLQKLFCLSAVAVFCGVSSSYQIWEISDSEYSLLSSMRISFVRQPLCVTQEVLWQFSSFIYTWNQSWQSLLQNTICLLLRAFPLTLLWECAHWFTRWHTEKFVVNRLLVTFERNSSVEAKLAGTSLDVCKSFLLWGLQHFLLNLLWEC